MSSVDRRDFLHLLNPNRRHRPGVQAFFKAHPKLQHVWIERGSHPTHLETVVEWALNEGARQIAVWGGDGTFSRTIQSLHRFKAITKTHMALVPAGTGNDFARKVGLPAWDKAVKVVFSEKALWKKFDLGRLRTYGGERVFVNNAGFGRTPKAVREKISNPLRDIDNFRERRLEVEWETEAIKNVETMRAMLGLVFNGPYFNKGMYFDKSISPSDGLLNAVLVPYQSKRKLIIRFLKSRFGFSLSHHADIQLAGQSIKMESEEDFFTQVDGESVSDVGSKAVWFDVMNGVLRLLIPGGTV